MSPRFPRHPRHLAVVEAYSGLIEPLTADPAERRGARGLGLPLAELAEALDTRFTVLTWDAWERTETAFGSPFTWDHVAATRPAEPPAPPEPPPDLGPQVAWREVPAAGGKPGPPPPRDPGEPAGARPDRRQRPPAFLLSWRLNEELAQVFRKDPFDAVLVPQWGGLGYVPMMARATGVAGFEAPFGVVVTDLSRRRQEANQEGLWTRVALVRRQAEDLCSLALAEAALAFGPRGEAAAREGRLPEAPPPAAGAPAGGPGGAGADRPAAAADGPVRGDAVQIFLEEPRTERPARWPPWTRRGSWTSRSSAPGRPWSSRR